MIELKRALDLCGFKPGERFAVAAIKNKVIKPGTFTDVDQAEDFLGSWDGWNHYFTGNPVSPEFTGARPRATDIVERRVMLIDIDPSGSMPVKDLAHEVHGMTGGILVFSGRGYQIWLRVDGDVDCETLLKGLRVRFARPWAKIDGTHDASRLMRCPGTVNHKTGQEAEIIQNVPGVVSPGIVKAWKLPAPKDVTLSAVDNTPVSPEDRALMSPTMRKIWDETNIKDRSARDCRFVLEGINHGLPEATVSRLLFSLPGGKGNDDQRGEDYWQSCLKWAKENTPDPASAMAEVLTIGAADPDSLFSAENLTTLRELRKDGPTWQKTRRMLKTLPNLSVPALEKEMNTMPQAAVAELTSACRFVICQGSQVGWFLTIHGGWTAVAKDTIRTSLAGMDVDEVTAAAVRDAYELTHDPFTPEYPRPHVWNKGCAFACEPKPGPHPTWDTIHQTVGRGIDQDVQGSAWCKANEIKDGSQYLRAWLASMLQSPAEPTAYLFFCGPERSGKSTFWESLTNIINEDGVVEADTALSTNFNEELAGAVVAVIDDYTLPNRRDAKEYNSLKRWVTAQRIKIVGKGLKPYHTKSYLHWVQTGNTAGDCPVFDGDTRITVIPVEVAEGEARMTKRDMNAKLKKEAPAFLHTLLSATLPGSGPRLAVPALSGELKETLARSNRSDFDSWRATYPEWVWLTQDEMYEEFTNSLNLNKRQYWPPRKVRQLTVGMQADLRSLAARIRAFDGEFRGSDFGLTRKNGHLLRALALTGRLEKTRRYENVQHWVYLPCPSDSVTSTTAGG